ncbi:hypothetical protein [Dyadobacter sp. CY326]|uniref:hypothetical protein n=1 Tax=Dyadobacter sp. CY326 TaxID=2907300 RepID=UPI001F25F434|nr:hypothetical protein [Dyadobacter sp. CY326]MCE7064954.1 hypothetical protein [Dyadobacter sp. CY326]
MKKHFMCAVLAAMFLAGCTKNNEGQDQSTGGGSMDSSVVGTDTNSVDVRKNIDQSDPAKATTPGQDTLNSDEPR